MYPKAASLAVITFLSLALHAQMGPPAPSTPARNPSFLDGDTLFASIFAGAGISSDGTVRPASAHLGGSAGMEVLSREVGGLGVTQFFELGSIGPLAGRRAPAAFLSYDLGTNILLSRDTHTVPFAVAGYSYLFGEASALNFGIGADLHYQQYRAIRLEIRDYYTFTQTPQHNVALRVGWQFSINDP